MPLVTIKEKVAIPQQIVKTVAASGTPEAITATSPTYFRHAMFTGHNDEARTANTGNVWLGVTSGNSTQPIRIVPNQTITLEAPLGLMFDLSSWYLDVATNGDGVVVIYS